MCSLLAGFLLSFGLILPGAFLFLPGETQFVPTPVPFPTAGPVITRLILEPDVATFTEPQLVEARDIIRARLVALGLPNTNVRVEDGVIVVELPATEDFDSVVANITGSGLLEFVNLSGLSGAEVVGLRINTINQQYADGINHPETEQPFESIITGADLQNVTPIFDNNTASWLISFETQPEGAEKLGAFTETHIGEVMAIVVNGEVISAPIIQSRLDTAGVISGNFTEAEARRLAIQLNTGELPVPLTLHSIEAIN